VSLTRPPLGVLDVDDWRLAGDGDRFLERADAQVGVDRGHEKNKSLSRFDGPPSDPLTDLRGSDR